jgi:signal peptidase
MIKKCINLIKRFIKNRVVKKTCDICINLLIVLLVVVIGFSIYGNIKTNGKDFKAPSVGPYMWMSVLSNSMKPTFSTGDLVVAKKVDVKNVKVGDIITFRWNTSLATHRIAEVIKDKDGSTSFKTKGDNNNAVDVEVLKQSYVVGEYVFRIPFIGYVLTKLKGLTGVILIWVMFVLVVGTEIYKNIKDSKKRKIKDIVSEE